MEKIKLQVSGSQIEVVEQPSVITAGTVGITAEFVFDSHWNALSKTAVFKAGDKIVATALEGNAHIVPWEVLEKPNQWLCIGVYGANQADTVVIPTLWAQVAMVHTGADPEGDPALEPTAPLWQEVLTKVEQIDLDSLGGAPLERLEDAENFLHEIGSITYDSERILSMHINNADGDNPHGVTCEQILAVHVDELDMRVRNVLFEDGVTEHLMDKEGNPHGVTCEQIGAATADALFEVSTVLTAAEGMAYDNKAAIENHANNTGGDNPHGVTCEQIGAAPSGYGCGETSPKAQNWNTQFRNGFYRESANSPDGSVWYGITCVDNSNYQTQIAFKRSADGLVEARRQKYSGAWGEWEYVNPPMLEGVEYRTTERYNGKAVYTKLVNLGSSFDAETENHIHVATGAVEVVDAKFSVVDGDCTYFSRDGYNWYMDVIDGYCHCIFILNSYFPEGATARVIVKYTKE